ncbi:hypothetical protein [Sphingomonas sp. RT2P30]|uniref:hypothetical protein n=1 Tax=Parasphingomonas halimpatiens TaxID=3096162 RepID=UPI002FCB5E07
MRLFDPNGVRIEINSRKGTALLALLATAPSGERSRSWLEERLWGSRAPQQAKGSLRRELANLRESLRSHGAVPITADRERIALDLTQFSIDVREWEQSGQPSSFLAPVQFLEGLDLAGEDGFEEWLRLQRTRFFAPGMPARTPSADPLPTRILDVSKPTPGFGGRPAIAVLPFANITGNESTDMWADGVTHDLVDRLSRLRWIPVIAMSSKGDVDVARLTSSAVGELVGASYVVRGQLAKRDGSLILQVSLFDAKRAQLLWSMQRPLEGGVTHEALGGLAQDIVANLDAYVDTAQQSLVINRAVADLDIDEMVWRARWHLSRLTRADAAIADELLGRSIQAKPNSAEVLIQSALAKAWSIWSRREPPAAIEVMRALALRAVAADGFDARGYMLTGMAEMWLRNHARAQSLFDDAIHLNPSLASAYAQSGSNHYLAGRPADAILPLKTALRLSPLDNQVFYILGELAISHFMLGAYEPALDFTELSLARRPAYSFAHTIRINCLVAEGRRPEAKRALAELMRARPRFDPSELEWLPFADRAWIETLRRGLADAEDPST